MPTPAEAALTATIGELATRTQYETMAAGRGVVQESAPRWRRVTDGAPCGFCAMLASRGPVYRSAGKAGQGNRYHGRCGCTAEPFDGDPDDWEPSPDEQRFIDAYNAVHQPGMTGEETARLMDEWMAKNPLVLTIDGLDDDAADALMSRLMDAGDFDGAARVGELLDARAKATKAEVVEQLRDMRQDFHPAAYEWFEELSEDDKAAYLDQYQDQRLMDEFLQEQWAHVNGKSVPKRGAIPPEREIRAAWEDYLYRETLRIEAATNGFYLSKKGQIAGRSAYDLLRGNERSVKAWASDEALDYFDQNGRLSYAAFKAGYTGDTEALKLSGKTYWAG